MASQGNQHRANCIGTLSFPIARFTPFHLTLFTQHLFKIQTQRVQCGSVQQGTKCTNNCTV